MSRKHFLNEKGLKKLIKEHMLAEKRLSQLQEQEEKISNLLERYEEGEELSEEEINELMGGLSALGKWGKEKASGAVNKAADNVRAAAGKVYGAAQKFAGDAAHQYQKGQRASAINKQRVKVDKQQAANTKMVQKVAEKGNRINQIIKQHQVELDALKQQYKKLTGKDFIPGRAVANAQRYVDEGKKKSLSINEFGEGRHTEEDAMARHIASPFGMNVIPGSANYTERPSADNDGSYSFRFLLAFNDKFIDEDRIEEEIGTYSYNGPGQAYSKTRVSFEEELNGQRIFSVNVTGGYDI